MKKIKENMYIQKFIELWNIPRYRSLLILGLYIIFFTVVIASVRSKNSSIDYTSNKKMSIIQNFEQMNNYQVKVTIQNEPDRTLISRVYNNRQIITYNNKNYYYDGSKLYEKLDSYIETESMLEFDIWRFTPLFIKNLIDKGKLDSKTEYANGIIANNYVVSIDNFIKDYSNDEPENNENISITTYQDKEQIIKVELDLTHIYRMQEFSNSSDYKVILEYSLIGEISPIVVNIESSD